MDKDFEYYMSIICELTGLTREDILRRTRLNYIAMVRYMIMQKLRDKGYKLRDIGERFNLCHATVFNGLEHIRHIALCGNKNYIALWRDFNLRCREEQIEDRIKDILERHGWYTPEVLTKEIMEAIKNE